MTTIKKTFDALDGALYRRGYVHPDVRALVRNQVVLATGCALLCIPFLASGAWAWSFPAGALLITLNFMSLARFGQQVTGLGKTEAVLSVLFRFYLRLGLTGAVLYVLIVFAHAQVFALLAGLSTLVVNLLFRGLSRLAFGARELPN